MPTDEDRASASIRFEGEARRLSIRRPRLDRDGLFLFGRRYAAQTVTLTGEEVDRLRRGRPSRLQKVAGHASITTTELYTRSSSTEAALAIREIVNGSNREVTIRGGEIAAKHGFTRSFNL